MKMKRIKNNLIFNEFKNEKLENEVSEYISKKIGKVAKPKKVLVLSDLPKTRTGKIMRRVLQAKLLGKPLGDLSSLENPDVLNEIHMLK